MVELASLVVGLVLFSIAPNLAPNEIVEDVEQCQSISADSCMQTSTCDVFELADGQESCQLSCDLRTGAASCAVNTNCEWREGQCEYASTLPDC